MSAAAPEKKKKIISDRINKNTPPRSPQEIYFETKQTNNFFFGLLPTTIEGIHDGATAEVVSESEKPVNIDSSSNDNKDENTAHWTTGESPECLCLCSNTSKIHCSRTKTNQSPLYKLSRQEQIITCTCNQSSCPCSYECKTQHTNQSDNVSLHPSAHMAQKQILSSEGKLSEDLLSGTMLLLSRDPSNESESKQDKLESIFRSEHKTMNTKIDKIDEIKVRDKDDKSYDKIKVRDKNDKITDHKIDSKSENSLEVVNNLNYSNTGARPKTSKKTECNLPTGGDTGGDSELRANGGVKLFDALPASTTKTAGGDHWLGVFADKWPRLDQMKPKNYSSATNSPSRRIKTGTVANLRAKFEDTGTLARENIDNEAKVEVKRLKTFSKKSLTPTSKKSNRSAKKFSKKAVLDPHQSRIDDYLRGVDRKI